VVLASYSDVYKHTSSLAQLATSITSGSKYVMDADSRAQQVYALHTCVPFFSSSVEAHVGLDGDLNGCLTTSCARNICVENR